MQADLKPLQDALTHLSHDLVAERATCSQELLRSVALLKDAIDAVEIDESEIAVERIKSAIETIRPFI